MKNISNNQRNQLTEPENHKKINLEMIDAYLALHPLSLSKLSISIFNIIMDTKGNHEKDSQFYKYENKRIFNNLYVSLEDILNRCHPVKYNIENKNISNDISNLMGRIQELDDNNIFYIWKYGKPITYLFVMERDIGLWKYFNTNAYVTPKTIKKIIALSEYIIDSMCKFEKIKNRESTLQDIEMSFVNEFLQSIIKKMNPEVYNKIPKYIKHNNVKEYIKELNDHLNKIDDYEGFVEDDLFMNRLPYHLQDKIKKEEKKELNMNVDIEKKLSEMLIPKDENLVIKKTRKYEKKNHKISNVIEAETVQTTFKQLNPFSNCNDFINYYREVIKSHNDNAAFYPLSSERTNATKIMDCLIENGKVSDMDFLRSWIRYYIQSYLHGNNIYKKDKTSLSNFQKTFEMYNKKYFRG
jgi:hypothetical protein